MTLFGEYLKMARERAGLSQEGLADEAEISSAYVSQLETGRRNPPTPDVLRRMAGPLGVPVTTLMMQAGQLTDQDLQEILLRAVRELFATGDEREALEGVLREAINRWLSLDEKERQNVLDVSNVDHVAELILDALLQAQSDILFAELFSHDEAYQ